MGLCVEIYLFLLLWKALLVRVRDGVIKAIREFTHEWILAVHNAKCMAQKPSKVFISIYLPKKTINHLTKP